MKSTAVLFLATTCLLVSAEIVAARLVRVWSYQELLEESDLVVIANAETNSDTKEHIHLPGFEGIRVIGVDTRFSVTSVLKGDKAQRDLVFHHYRPDFGSNGVINPPTFVAFAVSEKPAALPRTYILFLLREADGRYAPVVGQADPGRGVRELAGVYGSPSDETQTKLGINIGNVLKECKMVRPGMTRADLSRFFSTEGRFLSVTHRKYVYRDCPYIHIDVDFAPSSPKRDAESPTDVVTKITKPYLDWSIAD